MKKLVLIDSNAIIHRAYHALPKTMSNRQGEQTNAIYGFTTTLIKVLEDLHPCYIAASFDLAGPTFRHEHYKEYKATRIKADQELYDQIPHIKELLVTMKIPIYEKQGFEADDIIGTIVRKTQETSKNIQTYIVSGDKDIYQLVNGNVFVYSLRRGLSQMQIIDRQTIENEYDLQPNDFIDLKALAGDPSDNIPGVPGIGEKTAVDLIQRYDTIDKLYDKIADFLDRDGIISKSAFLNSKQISNSSSENSNIEKLIENFKLKIENYFNGIKKMSDEMKIKPRILGLLISYQPQAFLSQKLATIHRDVPIGFFLEDCRWGEYDKEKLQKLFEELGFLSLLRRFDKSSKTDESKSKKDEDQKAEIGKNDEQLKLL